MGRRRRRGTEEQQARRALISELLSADNPGFLLTYTGYENLSLLVGIRNKIGKEEIIQAMERVGLQHDDKRKVKGYSLGMKQRLALAQAIMEQPRLMLLDEPTRGLDQDSVDMIRKLLLEIKPNGTTIILSSHNKEDISTLCSRRFRTGVFSPVHNITFDRFGVIRDYLYDRDENGEYFFGIPKGNKIEVYLLTSAEDLYEYLVEESEGIVLMAGKVG